MNIYVGGSERDIGNLGEFRKFLNALGTSIVMKGHRLLNSCSNRVDMELATAANQWLAKKKKNPKYYIISYRTPSRKPAHDKGSVRRSKLPDWNMAHAELLVPEQIRKANVTMFIAGGEGTYLARNWARWAHKPILGIPRFGGAGEQIFYQELHRIQDDNSPEAEDYELLNQDTSTFSDYASDIIMVAERILVPRSVFPIMPFKPEWRWIYECFRKACIKHGFLAERTDDSISFERINPRIESGIAKCAFVLADISEASANVYFEIGLARGRHKPLIVTAKNGTNLPFDLVDFPVLFWNSADDLMPGIEKRISALRKKIEPSDYDLDSIAG
jgi:hypothetical protein